MALGGISPFEKWTVWKPYWSYQKMQSQQMIHNFPKCTQTIVKYEPFICNLHRNLYENENTHKRRETPRWKMEWKKKEEEKI